MDKQTVRYERLGAVARITLNRPQAMNALNGALRAELGRALDEVEQDAEIRAVVLTGTGRAFSAGVDLKEAGGGGRPSTPEGWRQRLAPSIDESMRIFNFEKPVVAAVNGHALGAGLDLVLCADLAIASSEATFGAPEIAFYSAPPTLLLPWVVGMRKCKELLLTGRSFGAEEAERMELVNRVVPSDQLQDAALEMANRLAKMPALSLKYNKLAINQAYALQGLLQGLKYNLETSIQLYMQESPEERAARLRFMAEKGLRAFHEVGYDRAVAEGRALLEQASEGAPA